MQSAQEEESSLDQTTKGIDREPSRFRAFCPGLERVQRDLHNSRQPGITRQDLESTKEPREYNEFRTIHVNYPRIQRNCRYPLEEKMIPKSAGSRSSLETRIPCNSRWLLYSSGFFVIREICSYRKYIYCTIGAREFFYLHKYIRISKLLKVGVYQIGQSLCVYIAIDKKFKEKCLLIAG